MKLFLFALLSLPLSVLADGGLPNQPYIYVQGTAEVEKPADLAMLRFDVVARAADRVKANQEAQANAAKVFALLNSKKIAENDVVAQDLKSEPEFEESQNSSRSSGKIIGYKVDRPFEVKIRDVAVYPKLVDELIAIGGVEFSGISVDLSNKKEVRDQVADKALANARERAERTLKATGMKIDSDFAISPVTFPEIEATIFGAQEFGVRSARRVVAQETGAPEYRLAPVTISQSVHVIYLISPAK
jgi:uncharacterized protein